MPVVINWDCNVVHVVLHSVLWLDCAWLWLGGACLCLGFYVCLWFIGYWYGAGVIDLCDTVEVEGPDWMGYVV